MRKISEKGERKREETGRWKELSSHRSEVATTGLDGLDEEATGCRVAVYSTDEILHWWLVGKINEVTHMVDNQPGQMF